MWLIPEQNAARGRLVPTADGKAIAKIVERRKSIASVLLDFEREGSVSFHEGRDDVIALVAVVEVFQAVEVVQVPAQGSMLAVDLQVIVEGPGDDQVEVAVGQADTAASGECQQQGDEHGGAN